MPRSLQEILEHAEELERQFADHDPTDVRDAAPLHAIRDAVTERAASERRIAEAVALAAATGCGARRHSRRLRHRPVEVRD
ncbi:MAG: hypothetical protein ACRDWY_02975 [Actinomycetes bacterium]